VVNTSSAIRIHVHSTMPGDIPGDMLGNCRHTNMQMHMPTHRHMGMHTHTHRQAFTHKHARVHTNRHGRMGMNTQWCTCMFVPVCLI